MRHLFALLLFLATSALGQSSGQTMRGDALKRSQYATQSALNFFVETTGNDANDCASVSTPCLTLQAALNRIPKQIRHPVVVTMGAGTFPGAVIDGFTVQYAANTTIGSYLSVLGTMATFTPATGTSSGTATAGAAGSQQTFGTLTDSGQTWTVNDLRGRYIAITAGQGSGQTRVIASNTATIVTIAGTWSPAPNATSVYTLQTPGTVLNTNVVRPPTPIQSSGATGVLVVTNNADATDVISQGATIVVQNLELSNNGSVPGAFIGPGNRTLLRRVRVAQTGNTAAGMFARSSYTRFDNVSVTRATTANGSGFDVGGDGELAIANSTIVGSTWGIALNQMSAPSSLISGTQISGFGTRGIFVNGYPKGQFIGCRIDCTGGGQVGIQSGDLNYAPSGDGWLGYGMDISSCTTAAVASVGSTLSRMMLSWTGSGNAITVAASLGAKVMVDSTVVMTSTTADITLNTSTSYTLAEMRAGTPRKIVTDMSDSTAVFEN